MHGDFHVGEYLVQPDLNQVRNAQKRIHLEPKVMDVLVYLARHPGEVLPKERIIQAVWGDVFVSDEVLTYSISELRRALGDDAKNPSIVQTIPRKGYRLIAAVSPPVAPSPPDIAEGVRRGLLLPWAGVLMGLMIAVLGGVWWISWKTGASDKLALPQESPLTTYPGLELEPTLSPDGNQVALSWDGRNQDNFDIYVKVIGAEEPLRLTTHPGLDLSPSWSPDGRWIAFIRNEGGAQSKIILISPLGGSARELASVSVLTTGWGRERGPNLSWSPDSKWLAVSQRPSPDQPFSLFLVSVETGEAVPITKPPPTSSGDFSPSFSPLRQEVAFTRVFSVGGVADLHLLDLSAGRESALEPRRLTFDSGDASSPAWAGKGNAIVYSIRGWRRNLWRLDLAKPDRPRPLEGAGEAGTHAVFSGQRSRLVYAKLTADANIWRLDREGTQFAAPEKFIVSTSREANPRFSPDGSRIVFDSTRSGSCEIWACDREGSNLLQLTRFGGPAGGSPSWSPDGRRIAFDMRAGETADIYVIDANGGHPVKLTDHPADDVVPTWSRGGDWIYFSSRRSDNKLQLWKIPSKGGEAVQVTRNGGVCGLESADGRLLFFARREDPKTSSLWQKRVGGGEEKLLFESVGNFNSFEVTEEGIYFMPRPQPDGQVNVRFYSFRDEKIRNIAEVETDGWAEFRGFTVSPDDRTILFGLQVLQGSDLMLVENFR